MKYMDVKEFRETGYLQEVNRRLLHPLGLALEVTLDDGGNEQISGVWDYRDDPEGLRFAEVDAEKVGRIEHLWAERFEPRRERLGYIVQPYDPDELRPVKPGGRDGA
jgi:hypothetical protein